MEKIKLKKLQLTRSVHNTKFFAAYKKFILYRFKFSYEILVSKLLYKTELKITFLLIFLFSILEWSTKDYTEK
jgi:hypothetical protein